MRVKNVSVIIAILIVLLLGGSLTLYWHALTPATVTITYTTTVTETVTQTISPEIYPLTVVDALGRQVVISSEPLRVISLSPSITEILFSLNLGSRVIAVDSFSNYPPEVIELKDKGVIQDIGGFWSPDLEKIVALAPDVIIADSDAHMKFKDKFEELGLNVVFIRGGAAVTVEDILLDIMLVAKVFNVEDNGAKLIQNISEQLITIEEKVKEASKVKTLVLLGPPSLGLWTVGSGKFLNDIIHRAGGINIAEKYYGWIQLSLEEVISADPEVIIVLVMGTTEDAKAVINEIVNSELSETSAVKNGRVYVLIGEADDIVSRPGPRVAKATLLLAKIIHPDIFGEPERPDVISMGG